jgi:ferrous iron transport protein B
MAVPCSAQIAIIMGITGKYAGISYALLILLTLIALGVVIGLIMNRFLKYEPSNLAMALPELVMPQVKNILYKTWVRTKDFFTIAFPLLVVGSIIVEVMLGYNMLNAVVGPMSWLTVGMLGLPAVVIIAFIVGIVRKEMSVAMLVILAGDMTLTEFMTPEQFVVFGVVMSIFMPCVATLSVMGRELGWKDTIAVSMLSMFVAVMIGTMFHLAFTIF